VIAGLTLVEIMLFSKVISCYIFYNSRITGHIYFMNFVWPAYVIDKKF
jgi:hypothetical protein